MARGYKSDGDTRPSRPNPEKVRPATPPGTPEGKAANRAARAAAKGPKVRPAVPPSGVRRRRVAKKTVR